MICSAVGRHETKERTSRRSGELPDQSRRSPRAIIWATCSRSGPSCSASLSGMSMVSVIAIKSPKVAGVSNRSGGEENRRKNRASQRVQGSAPTIDTKTRRLAGTGNRVSLSLAETSDARLAIPFGDLYKTYVEQPRLKSIYQTRDGRYQIDTCEPQMRAVREGKIKLHALTKGHYPG